MVNSRNSRQTGPALEAAYQLVKWLAPTVEKFPRSQKFALGDRVLAAAYDLLERLIEATYTRERRPLLRAANLALEKLRLLCRLAYDLGHLDARLFEHAARQIDQTGRLVGGWMKSGDASSAWTSDGAPQAAH